MNYFIKSYKKTFMNIIVSFICLLVACIIMFYQNYNGYEILFTQPIIFLLVFIFVFSKIIIEDSSRLFFIVLIIISGIRYVILPLMVVLSGYYGGRSIVEPTSGSFFHAILLMNYELIVISLFIKIMEIRKKAKKSHIKINQTTNSQFTIKNNHLGYFIFGTFAIFGLALYPSVINSINFIIPTEITIETEYNFIQNLVLYSVIIFKQLLFLVILKKIYFKYEKTSNKKYLLFSFIVALINIFIYFGTNRSDILISAIVSFLVLYKLFGKLIRKYFILGGLAVIFIFFIVTGTREYLSISGGSSQLIDITDTFQVYTGGVYNVAIAIETKEYFPEAKKLSVFFFDIFRPMIGINLFVKNLPFEYSNIFFNRRMWLNVDRRSQILPMIGQGNLFFGFIFAPILSVLLIRLYYFFEKIIKTTKNLEVFYFLSLVTVRFGFFMGQNTMNMINDMSMNLVLFFVVYFFNRSIYK